MAMSHTRGALPKMNPAAVTFDDRPDVLQHERKQTAEITLPQIGPIGNAAVVELQQRPRANSQAGCMGPVNLRVGVCPIAPPFDGFDEAPSERQRYHVKCVDDMSRYVGLWQMGAQMHAKPRGKRPLLRAAHGERLLHVLGSKLAHGAGRGSQRM